MSTDDDLGRIESFLEPVEDGLADLFRELQESDAERLRDTLNQINRELDSRRDLHDSLTDELTGKVEWYLDRLEQQYQQQVHSSREELKNRIEELYRDLRQEKRAFWRDRQQLARERRELLRELAAIDDRTLLSNYTG